MRQGTKYLNSLYEAVLNDQRLQIRHTSLLMALILTCLHAGGDNPFIVTRARLMKLCKIQSKTTYHKCISELVEFGYIEYNPTYNSFRGTMIDLLFAISI